MKHLFSAAISAILAVSCLSSALTVQCADGNYLFGDSFNSETGTWKSRGSASVSLSTQNYYSGNGSLYIRNRSASWNGVMKEIKASEFQTGKSYSFSINAMQPGGKNNNVTFYMKLQYKDAEGTVKYSPIAEATTMRGKWVQLANSGYTIPDGATELIIYVETADGTENFYIDEAYGAASGTKFEGPAARAAVTGDFNFDGLVNIADYCLAKSMLIEGIKDEVLKINADVNADKKLDISDMTMMRGFLSGTVEKLPDPILPAPPEPETVKEPEQNQPDDFKYNANLQYKAAPSSYSTNCSQQGKVEKVSYKNTQNKNVDKTALVYLPYGYDANDKTKKYNVFYLMHGGGGNETSIFVEEPTLKKFLDHMIMNGDIEPMIVVTPTFNKSVGNDMTANAKDFHKELVADILPAIEGKYNTYAKSTSKDDLIASRGHRAFGGFSMGSLTTWYCFLNQLNYFEYFMPLSGDCWAGNTPEQKAESVANAVKKSGFKTNEYYLMCATGKKDIAYTAMSQQIEAMKKLTGQFVFTSDFSKGNFYFLTCNEGSHWWTGYIIHYIYDMLPYFFHNN